VVIWRNPEIEAMRSYGGRLASRSLFAGKAGNHPDLLPLIVGFDSPVAFGDPFFPPLLAYVHGCSVPTLNAEVFNAGPTCERVRVNGFNRHWLPRLALLAIDNWRSRARRFLPG
jgi:hypothetical protein